MTGLVVVSLLTIVVGTTVVRRFGPRRARLEIRSATGENFAIVLAAMEIAQFVATGTEIGARVHLSDIAFVPLCVVALGLAVAACVSRLVVVVVSMLGIAAGLVDVATDGGPNEAVAVLLAASTLLVVMMLARALLPRR